jgi:hypothetical protein
MVNSYKSTWYKRASINPWSIFENIEYNRETGLYENVVINKDSVSDLVSDVSDKKLFAVKTVVRQGARHHYTIMVGVLNIHGPDWVGINDSVEKKKKENEMVEDYTIKIMNVFETLGSKVMKFVGSDVVNRDSAYKATIGCIFLEFYKGLSEV